MSLSFFFCLSRSVALLVAQLEREFRRTVVVVGFSWLMASKSSCRSQPNPPYPDFDRQACEVICFSVDWKLRSSMSVMVRWIHATFSNFDGFLQACGEDLEHGLKVFEHYYGSKEDYAALPPQVHRDFDRQALAKTTKILLNVAHLRLWASTTVYSTLGPLLQTRMQGFGGKMIRCSLADALRTYCSSPSFFEEIRRDKPEPSGSDTDVEAPSSRRGSRSTHGSGKRSRQSFP